MEVVEETQNVIVLNDDPQFSVCDDTKVSANYFILCEENTESELSKNVYDCKIAGMSVLNWVVRACAAQPVILKVEKDADVIQTIRPYLDQDSDYSVVLYASTPLLNRTHISDLLGFVSRKQMNCCKLKKGFVFRNEYIREVDEIYSIDTYDFASNDFFEVNSYEDLAFAKEVLTKKVISYHKKNGVYFESEQNLSVDASTEIGYATEVSSGVIIANGTNIGENAKIAKNVTISGSKIGADTKIGIGAIVIDSIIKDGAVVDAGTIIKNSVIGNNVRVGLASKILSSSIRADAKISEMVTIDNAKIGENSVIGKHSKILGDKTKAIVGANCNVSINVTLVDFELESSAMVESNKVLISGKAV